MQRFPGEYSHMLLEETSAGSAGLGHSVGCRGEGPVEADRQDHELLTHFKKRAGPCSEDGTHNLRQRGEDDHASSRGETMGWKTRG